MATIGQLVVKLVGDTSDFQGAMQAAGTKMQNIGKQMQGVGLKMSAAITAPLTALGLKSIDAASDLEESMSKVGVVFGQVGDEIVVWSQGSAQAFGLSQQAALEAAGTYGNLFTAMGFGQQQAGSMSKSVVELSADLASFNNLDPTDVLDKLRAGLVGEAEPLRALGVNINQAMVEMKAMEMGLADADGNFSTAALTLARYNLIMEQTATAHGDFARTSDGLANQQRIMKAEFQNLAATIGQQLLPYAKQVVEWVRSLMGWFQNLSPAAQRVAVVIAIVAAAIGPLLIVVGTLISAIGTILPILTAVGAVLTGPVLLAIGLVVGAIALLALAWKNNWGGIREKTAEVINFIKGLIQSGLAAIQAFWAAHGAQIMGVVKALWAGIQNAFNIAVNVIKTIIKAFQAAMSGDWRKFGELMRSAWDQAWSAIVRAVSAAGALLRNAVTTLIRNAKTWFTSIDWSQVGKNMIQGIARGITSAASWIKEAAIKAVKAAVAAVKGFLGIDSPSKVFAEMGENMMRGMMIGYGQPVLPAPVMQGLPALGAPGAAGGLAGGGELPGMTVYGGVNLYGVQDAPGLLEQLQGMRV